MPERSVAVNGGDLTDAQLQVLAGNPDLEELTIWGGPWTNERLAPLSGMTGLKKLVLGEMAIDDGAFAHFRPMGGLECLVLAYTEIEGRFGRLAGLPLRDVRLEGCRRLGDAAATELAGFPTLRQVEVHMTRMTDRGLRALASLPLEVLWLGPHVTDEGVGALGGMTSLRHLDICAPGVTDQGVRRLAGLGGLEVLWLSNCRITDASLEVLCGLRALKELAVGHTGMTAGGRERLRAALPACRLVEEAS